MILHLNNEKFDDEIKNGVVIVDFYASWCGPCKMLSPVLEEIANERGENKIIKVDVDKHEDLARRYGIMSVPQVFIFKDGELKKQLVGFMPKSKILEEINNI